VDLLAVLEVDLAGERDVRLVEPLLLVLGADAVLEFQERRGDVAGVP